MSADEELQPRYPAGYWDKAAGYLRDCYLLQHNDDYLEFLVRQVWKLAQPCQMVEFGCGTGKMGLKLMPLLAEGSSYSGIDESAPLLASGRETWAALPWQGTFYEGSIYQTPFEDNSFDMALTHTVLMHVPHPECVLQEMLRVTRPGGLVITCEANRDAHTAMLKIEGPGHPGGGPFGLFQQINRSILERTGVDHNIGARLPILMQQVGLQDVQSRLSDAMRFLAPPLDTEEQQRLFKLICDEGYGQPAPDEEQRARWKANLVRMGIPEDEAEAEIVRELAEDFLNKGPGYSTVYTSMLNWSFGWVEK